MRVDHVFRGDGVDDAVDDGGVDDGRRVRGGGAGAGGGRVRQVGLGARGGPGGAQRLSRRAQG